MGFLQRPKLAVVTDSAPPGSTGQDVLLCRTFAADAPDSYCTISNIRPEGAVPGVNVTEKLPGASYYLPAPRRFFWMTVALRAVRIAGLVRRERCGAVLALTGDMTHIPAAWLASRMTGVPFFIYELDHYVAREALDKRASFWARLLEGVVFRAAHRVLVLNENLAEDLYERLGVTAIVTGNIYSAHYDAFVNLTQALERPACPSAVLEVYAPQKSQLLAGHGITGKVSPRPLVPLSEVARVHQHACGLLVDRCEPEALADALAQLASDPELRRRLSERAWERARADFDLRSYRATFAGTLAS